MDRKITNLIEIPDGVRVFSKYMDQGKTFYSRCHFIAVCDDGSTFFAEIDDFLGVSNPEDASNCIGIKVVDTEAWISAEEFFEKYKPDEYDHFKKLMED